MEWLLDPRDSDTDDDGLPDGTELAVGTSPLDADSDGDYLLDGHEVHANETLPGASPLRRDIYVELDYHPNCTIPREQIALIQERFANAPVDNPDGSTGINLHIRIDEQVTGFNTSGNAQYDSKGHYYGVASPSIADDKMRGWAAPIGFHVKCADPPGEFGTILMHELGHVLGLSSTEYEGIDSWDVPLRKYPSVMNYNANAGYSRFSSGEGYDDWAAIEREQPKPDTSGLNRSSA